MSENNGNNRGNYVCVYPAITQDVGVVASNIFSVVRAYCNMEYGYCWASQEKIAKRSGYCVSAVKCALNRLITAGYLTVERTNRTNRYYVTGHFKTVLDAYDDAADMQEMQSINNSDSQQMATKDTSDSQQMATKDFCKPLDGYPNSQQMATNRSLIDNSKELIELTAAAVSANEKNFTEVFKVYEAEIGAITDYSAEQLKAAISKYSAEWIKAAISEAAAHNVRKWSYVVAILKRWKIDGFKVDDRAKAEPAKKVRTEPAKRSATDSELADWRRLREQFKSS